MAAMRPEAPPPKTAMIWAVSQKLLEGTGAGLEPQAYGTRAQSAQIILNFSLYVG